MTINLIQVYAPTLNKPDTNILTTYKEVKQFIKTVKNNKVLIIMGDFNAKVGQGRVDDTVGDYGLGVRNARGDILVQFWQEEKL